MRWLVGVILLPAFHLAAQPQPDGRELLRQVAAAYQSVPGYELDATITNRPSGEDSKTTTVAIAYAAPDRLMLQDKGTKVITSFHDHGVATYNTHGGGFVSPGTAARIDPRAQALAEADRRTRALQVIGFTDYAHIANHLTSAHILRQENFDLAGSNISCTVVEASYPNNTWRTFWIDESRHNVLREVDVEPTREHTIDVLKLSWGEAPPYQLFEIEKSMRVKVGGYVAPQVMNYVPCQLTTPEAEIARVKSAVGLKATVDIHGQLSDIEVIQPVGLGLDELAIACFSQNEFRPAERDGQVVEGKLQPHIGVFAEPNEPHSRSGWGLNRITFQNPRNTTRPTFLKAEYPSTSGVAGHAIFHLTATIDKTGVPRNIEVTGPPNEKLRKDAVKIANSYRFNPGEDAGTPIEVPVAFDLLLGQEAISGQPSNQPNCDVTTAETELARLNGKVSLRLSVDADGNTQNIQIAQSLGLGADERAVECLSKPSRPLLGRDGKPIFGNTSVAISVRSDPSFSDWSIARAAFDLLSGTSRPVLVKAKYPNPEKRTNGGFRSATVHLTMTIDKTGVPRNIHVIASDLAKIDSEAIEIANTWRFQPAMRDGQPVDVTASLDLSKAWAIRNTSSK